jgi:hypothetical protein
VQVATVDRVLGPPRLIAPADPLADDDAEAGTDRLPVVNELLVQRGRVRRVRRRTLGHLGDDLGPRQRPRRLVQQRQQIEDPLDGIDPTHFTSVVDAESPSGVECQNEGEH